MPEIKLVYQQIKEHIRKEAKGKKPGDALKTEVGYSTMFSVSRPTVRKAVEELVAEGMVKRIPGKGLAVANDVDRQKVFRGSLAFILPYIPGDGFFYNTLTGCIDAANVSGYDYAVLSRQEIKEKYNDNIDHRRYQGIILAAYNNPKDRELVRNLKEAGLPFVLVDNPLDDMDTPYVITDDYNGGCLGAEYLIAKGHSRILYITLNSGAHTVEQRKQGFLDTMRKHGVAFPREYLLELEKDEDIYRLLPDIKVPYTAICSYSDLPVIMAYNVLLRKGVRIAEEVSLLGYGNFNASQLLMPPLSTVGMPVYEMGRRAAEMLTAKLEGKAEPGRVVLDVELIERGSVAAL
jgi:DNA-binding LacI/PurR family transcriptional regulator